MQLVPTSTDSTSTSPTPLRRANDLGSQERKEIAVKALAHREPITKIAGAVNVSRKFVYAQAERASAALDKAFEPDPKDEDEVLFYYPVTKKSIRMIVLALILWCHSSYRGVIGFFLDVFDHKLSIGTVHNIVAEATYCAKRINAAEDLTAIKIGALDEIFQGGEPVLVGVDPFSTYCFLLSQEAHRDGTTWGVHLLDLVDKGLLLDYAIADGGKGLRAGVKEALPGTPCREDVFHPLRDMKKMTTYLDNRALKAINSHEEIKLKMEKAKMRSKGHSYSKMLALATNNATVTIQLADDMRLLCDWMSKDVLSLNGPLASIRKELFDFIVKEMQALEHLAPDHIKPVRVMLANQRDDLLAFVYEIDQRLAELANTHHVALQSIRTVFDLYAIPESDPLYWKTEAALFKQLGEKYRHIKQEVEKILEQIVRASSMVENLNSRLRCYFFLRHQLGSDYLELLRFFLNHRRFQRSRSGREGRSPAEILKGACLPHWLEKLGFTLFRKVA